MKTSALIVIVALIAVANSQDDTGVSRKAKLEESAKKVKELQMERIETLVQMVAQLAALHGQARVKINDVWEGQRLLVEAQLDSAGTDEQRIQLHNRLVELLKSLEKHAEGLAEKGQEVQPTVLKAKARRLEAEIHLEQAKIKLAKPVE